MRIIAGAGMGHLASWVGTDRGMWTCCARASRRSHSEERLQYESQRHHSRTRILFPWSNRTEHPLAKPGCPIGAVSLPGLALVASTLSPTTHSTLRDRHQSPVNPCPAAPPPIHTYSRSCKARVASWQPSHSSCCSVGPWKRSSGLRPSGRDWAASGPSTAAPAGTGMASFDKVPPH
jgi:hypothetical protein